MTVRQTRNGDISVDARPRVIQCSPSVGSVHVRSSHIDMGVQVSSHSTFPHMPMPSGVKTNLCLRFLMHLAPNGMSSKQITSLLAVVAH